MVTEAIRSRMVWVITGVLALLVLLALPAKAESADYETTLDRLGRLQALAEQYIEEKNSGDDPIDLTLSFTRVGDYNTTIWQLTAGTRDGEFEKVRHRCRPGPVGFAGDEHRGTAQRAEH